jgi:RimJ/RimL family protein N-acetyltransferase
MATSERQLRTDRLLLRGWRNSDLEPFAELNADPEVMRYFPAPLSREESDAIAGRAADGLAERGWGLWAVEHDGAFLGFTGLAVPRFEAHFTPAVGNRRSRAVMERIGMVRDERGDFDHPNVPETSPLRRHVLYRAEKAWNGL